jgi:glycosyltransferase involved in cell wall biosynthesis
MSRMVPPPPTDRRRLLVFEPDAEGHALEWLQHLIAYNENGVEILVLAAAPLCAALAKTMPATAGARVRLLPLSPLERRLCLQRPLPFAALARWAIVRRHLARTGADSVFFLMLDLQSLPLALGLGVGGPRVSGILFRPSVHYGAIGPYAPSAQERRRDKRKHVLYRRMLANPALERVFSLDPYFPVYAQACYPHGDKIQPLPDPAHPTVEPTAVRIDAYPPKGRTAFLLFGYLTERKGPLEVLDALALLPPAIAGRVAMLFAGRIDPDLAERIAQRQRQLAETQPDLWLRIDDRRLESAELSALVRQSDVVLAPYQRFVGSSGVLLWAAGAGRPVLAQDFGLVGRLTRDHRLGVSADCGDPAILSRAIVRMVECGPATLIDRTAAAEFVSAHRPQHFASLVLSV